MVNVGRKVTLIDFDDLGKESAFVSDHCWVRDFVERLLRFLRCGLQINSRI